MKNETRHVLALVLAWGGWLGCAGVFLYSSIRYNPAAGKFAPQWVGFTFIMLMGVGIAAGTALARHSLRDTIIEVFRAGLNAPRISSPRKSLENEERETS